MNKYSKSEEEFGLLPEQPFDILGIFIKYLFYWKWFLVSLCICISIAAVYLYFTLPNYGIKTSILIKDDVKGGSSVEMNVFNDMSIITQKNNADNELELLKNSLIVEKAVRELGVYVNYYKISTLSWVQKLGINKILPNVGKYRSVVLYGKECPILFSLADSSAKELSVDHEFRVLFHPNGNCEFYGTYNNKPFKVNALISDKKVKLPSGVINIPERNFTPTEDMLIEVIIQNSMSVAIGFLGQIKMEMASKGSSVVNISMICSNVVLGQDFLKKYIEIYNREEIRDQLAMATKTSQLIEEHLNALSKELSNVESQAENYKQSQGITDLASQTEMYNAQTTDAEQKRLELETQLSIVSSLNRFIQSNERSEQLIPSNSGIKSSGINEMISDYNKLILNKNRLSRIASGSNQAMIDLNNKIESTYNTVKSGLQNEQNNLQIAHRDISSKYNQTSARIRAVPRQERQYTEIKRQQSVREGLFLYLLQKKEEKYMNMSSVSPSTKLIDNIRNAGQVSPRSKIILLISLLIGILIPVIAIKIRDLLRYQIGNKEELEAISIVPILGEIPKTGQMGNVLVKENNTDSFTELVRLLRTNLLFVLDSPDKKVINMLSSVSGEGKTFVTINLAISLALLEKKVLMIELDVRKPKLAEYIGIKSKVGISLFLSGQIAQEDLVIPSGIHPNLYILPSGSIPPNPNELLAKPALDNLLADFRKQYDYILIDTAPVGVVSDSLLLDRLTDVNLYVVRADYTPKKNIEDATNLFKMNKLQNMYFILNNVNMEKHTYHNGYGKKYGYGYGYGKNKYTYGYNSEPSKS